MSAKSISALSSRSDEKLNIAAPLLFATLALMEISLGWRFDSIQAAILYFVAAFVFFNFHHVPFVLFNILFVRSFRSINENFKKSGKDLRKRSVFVFLIAASLHLFIFKVWPSPIYIQIILLGLLVYFGAHHRMFQSYGLLQIYNQKTLNTSIGTTLPKVEKVSAYILTLTYGLIFVSLVLTRDFETTAFIQLRKLSAAVALLPALTLIGCAFWQKNINKILFSLRFILVPAAGYSLIAFFAILAFHGIESFFIQKHIIKKTSQELNSKNKIFILIVSLFSFAFIYSGLSFLGPNWSTLNEKLIPASLITWSLILGCITQGVAFVHYYLERYVFKFNAVESRNELKELFIAP